MICKDEVKPPLLSCLLQGTEKPPLCFNLTLFHTTSPRIQKIYIPFININRILSSFCDNIFTFYDKNLADGVGVPSAFSVNIKF